MGKRPNPNKAFVESARVLGFGFRVEGLGFRVLGLRFRVRVWGLGCRSLSHVRLPLEGGYTLNQLNL